MARPSELAIVRAPIVRGTFVRKLRFDSVSAFLMSLFARFDNNPSLRTRLLCFVCSKVVLMSWVEGVRLLGRRNFDHFLPRAT